MTLVRGPVEIKQAKLAALVAQEEELAVKVEGRNIEKHAVFLWFSTPKRSSGTFLGAFWNLWDRL